MEHREPQTLVLAQVVKAVLVGITGAVVVALQTLLAVLRAAVAVRALSE
jgi:hypothetical protein